MSIVVTVLHVLACFVLIVVVLLQTGKGADIGAVFGGSSQTIFGSSGAGNLLTKLTTWTAVLFMVTSLFLTWSSTRHLTSSIADTLPAEPAPVSAPLENDATSATAPGEGGAGEEENAPAAGAASDATTTAPSGQADGGAKADSAGAPKAADAAPGAGTGGAAKSAADKAKDAVADSSSAAPAAPAPAAPAPAAP